MTALVMPSGDHDHDLDHDHDAQGDPRWERVCLETDLTPDRGVAALVGRHQVALFLVAPPDGRRTGGELFAVGHLDPCSGANVLARGLVGSVGRGPGEQVVVASPVHKQRFDLRTGRCLDEDASVPTFAVRRRNGWVEVRRPDDG